MKTKLLFLLIFQICASYLFAQKFEKIKNNGIIPAVKIYESGKQENFYVSPRTKTKSGIKTATFEIKYTGFTEEAKAAFQAAADIWSQLLSSTVPITIDARWEPMDQGILGSSGSPELFKNFKNAPFKDTWYKPTIANKLAGVDLSPEGYDMIIRYNSNANWYLGTDGKPGNQTDFLSVVLHEIGHGLGFADGCVTNGTIAGIGFVDDNEEGPFPVSFDHFMYNGDGDQIIDTNIFENPSVELLNELTSNNIYFDSPLSNEANGGTPAKLYAPSTYNPGSSIAHLDEIYNGTENALMTFSIGTGEAEHDPGPISMGLFAESGWVSVRFDHDHLKDMESWTEPITISTEIYADTSLYDNSVFLHYSSDNFKTEDKVLMNTTDNVLYKYDVPVQSTDTLWYYIEGKSKLDRFYFYPSQGEGSINAKFNGNSLFFRIGDDITEPEIKYEQELDYIFDFTKEYKIELEADDNIGIDSVYIEYIINNNASKFIKMSYDGGNPIGLPKYSTAISLLEETLSDLDTLYYKIFAVDSSTNHNVKALPQNGYYKMPIYEYLKAVSDTVIDLDQVNEVNLFINQGISVSQPDGFNSLGLHSPHPYEEGEGKPNDEINYSTILKMPIILSDPGYIVYDEIVLVEPCENGTSYGDAQFWDYVIVEGSKDSGKTWHEFADGYDCNISSTFISAFNSQSSGNNDMYISHKIDLLGNENLVANDTVLVRFRLWSDPGTVGWGWAIDNIKIQKDAVPPTIPTSLEATEVTDTTVNLSWIESTDNESSVSYIIYMNDTEVEKVTDTEYIVRGLWLRTSYSFYVKAVDEMENLSDKSNTVNVTTTNTTDVADINSNTGNFIIYPNPALNYINIDYTNEKLVNDLYLTIYNIEGKIIYNKNYKVNGNKLSEQINTENFNKGIYIVKLSSSKVSQVQRLIIK